MGRGDLVEINATEDIVKPEFEKYKQQGYQMFVLDGFPRDKEILNHWLQA